MAILKVDLDSDEILSWDGGLENVAGSMSALIKSVSKDVPAKALGSAIDIPL